MNPETEGKDSLLVTFIQRFVTQSKLSLNFTETPLFPPKTAYFLNNLHDAYKNADCNSKFNTVELLNSGHLRFLKNLSIIERYLLLGGNFKKIVTFGT